MARRTGWRRGRCDGGAISLFVAISAVALLALVGLVVDCGGRLQAVEDADAAAQEAARAGGEQIDQAAALRGDGIRVDPAQARAAALAYLAQDHLTGEVRATATTVTVTVHSQYHTLLLGVIGLGTLSVHGQGRAVLVQGADQAVNQAADLPEKP